MILEAVPRVKFMGYDITGNYNPGNQMMVLGSFSIDWGRDSTLTQPSPARLRVSFLTASTYDPLTQRPLDAPIEVWMKAGTFDQRIFYGQVRTGETTYVGVIDGEHRYRVDLEATDPLTNMGRTKWATGANKRNIERATVRIAAIAAKCTAEKLPILGIGGGGAVVQSLVDKDANGSLLEELTAVYNVAADSLGWDPHAQRIEGIGRPVPGDGSVRMIRNTTGKYTIAADGNGTASGQPRMEDHKVTVVTAQKMAAAQTISAVYTYGDIYDLTAGSVGKKPGIGVGIAQVAALRASHFELQLDSFFRQNGNTRYDDGLVESAEKWKLVVTDARIPTHPPIRTRHTAFDSEIDAELTLQCKAGRRHLYIPGSPFNLLRSDTQPLMVYTIGGTVAYTAKVNATATAPAQPARWDVERIFANAPIAAGTTFKPVTIDAVNPAGTVTLDDLDESVTIEACRYMSQGI